MRTISQHEKPNDALQKGAAGIISSFFCITISLLASVGITNAQWKQLNVGGSPPEIYALLVVQGDLIAATGSGIYRSTDRGESWTIENSDGPFCLGANDSAIFAGTASGVIYSTDKGITWDLRDSAMTYSTGSLDISDTIIFAVTQGGVLRSTDNGASWTAVDSGLTTGEYYSMSCIAISGKKIFLATGRALCVSTNEGESWSTISNNTLPPVPGLSSMAVTDSVVFYGTSYGMYKSTDNGSTWEPDTIGLSSIQIHSVAIHGGYVMAGTGRGVFLSSDMGEHWVSVSEGLPGSIYFPFAFVDSTIYVGTDNGVYSSTDDGTVWSSSSGGMVGAYVVNLWGNGGNIFAETNDWPYGDSLYSSTNNGDTWTKADNGISSSQIQSLAVDSSHVFAVVNDSLYVSSNDGRSWSRDAYGPMASTRVVAVAISGRSVLVSGYGGGLYSSFDEGSNWTNVDSGLPQVSFFTTLGSNVYVTTADGVYFSPDNGESWAIEDSMTGIYAIAASAVGLVTVTFQAPMPNPSPYPAPVFRVLCSSDNGKSWSSFMSGLATPPEYPTAVLPTPGMMAYGSDLYLAYEEGIYASKSGGSSWIDLNGGLPASFDYSVYVNDSSVFVGTNGAGIWDRPLSQVTAVNVEPSSSRPASFILNQNYPNPFNPSTIINYQLPVNSLVTLRVYDVLGRLVRTLVDERESAGSYSVTFNADGLASGVYFYRLDAGTFSETEKMMVVR